MLAGKIVTDIDYENGRRTFLVVLSSFRNILRVVLRTTAFPDSQVQLGLGAQTE